jgi:hypothetical protein
LYVSDYDSGNIHVYGLDGVPLGHMSVSSRGLAGLEIVCDIAGNSATCHLYYANALTNEIGVVEVSHTVSNISSKPLPLQTCNTKADMTRPRFNVMHGPGYQNPMVIKYSYGKHCAGFSPGQDLEAIGAKTLAELFMCPDRLDCNEVNGDAILMAGYLCHPCIPNPCQGSPCLDAMAYQCTSGFECPANLTQAKLQPHCDPTSMSIFSGSLEIVAQGLSKTQLETSARASLSTEFGVTESSIICEITEAHAESRRLKISSTAKWSNTFSVSVPATHLAKAQRKVATLQSFPSNLQGTMNQQLLKMGVNPSAVHISVRFFSASMVSQIGMPAVIANSTEFPTIKNPMDVKFHTADGKQLWIANHGRSNMLVLHLDGSNVASMKTWQDRAEYHYNDRVISLGFDNAGTSLVTCQDSRNNYYGMREANFFMGPTFYEIYPVGETYGRPNDDMASISPDGKKCTKGGYPDCYLIHSDMLHESPMCMGTVHDPGAVTKDGFHVGESRSGHAYFYSNGWHGELMRFDALSYHGPGTLDHRSANIRRYQDVKLTWVEGVPGHMVLDNTTRILYVADPGNKRVIRFAADGSEFKHGAQCVPDECYPSHASYKEGTCANGICTGGQCADAEGYGCNHIFTEQADQFEFEVWGCSTQDDFVTSLQLPSGLALGPGRLYVSDYASGNIHAYGLDGVPLGHMAVSSRGLAGLEIVCDTAGNLATCHIYYANSLTNEIGMVAINHTISNMSSKPLLLKTCNTKANMTRPRFNVMHGPGYQNPMVIKYSYGKHCAGFSPGQDLEAIGAKTLAELFMCPDRLDCNDVNGDAILMAGYLCHPCIPNPCKASPCLDTMAYQCTSGFECPADVTQAKLQAHCNPDSTSTFSGSLQISAQGLSKTQVETSARASFAAELNVNENSITLEATEFRRLNAAPRLPMEKGGTWNIVFSVSVPATKVAKVQRGISVIQANPSSFGKTMSKELVKRGVSAPPAGISVTSFSATESAIKPGSSTKSMSSITSTSTVSASASPGSTATTTSSGKGSVLGALGALENTSNIRRRRPTEPVGRASSTVAMPAGILLLILHMLGAPLA